MNVKSIPFCFFVSIGIQSVFSHPQLFTLSETIIQKMFSPQHWKTYKPILAKNITQLPQDIQIKLFTNRIYKNISFVGFPLQSIHFENCTFINVDFRGMDLSQTTFSQCKFKNVKIEGVKLTNQYTFSNKTPHLKLLEQYSHLITKQNKKATQLFNDLIFIAVKIEVKNFNLTELNLQGIQLKKAKLNDITLRNIEKAQFKDCFFTQVNLAGTDLVTTNFKGTTFSSYSVDLNDALLYKGFHFDGRLNDFQLVQQYSQLMNASEDGDLEALNKAKALNKILASKRIQLIDKNLVGLNLRGIKLKNANLARTNLRNTDLTKVDLRGTRLRGVQLQRARLSDTLIVNTESISDLFQQWVHAKGKNKKHYQKLIPTNLFFTGDISYEELKTFFNQRDKKEPLDLRYVIFESADLKELDFEGVDLRLANFWRANLTGAQFKNTKLTNTNFEYANLTGADFRGADITEASKIIDATLTGAILSETLTLDPDNNVQFFKIWSGAERKDKNICQWLINSSYRILNKIPNEDLKAYFNHLDEIILLDLSKAYLCQAQLQGVHLNMVNLKEACLTSANLTEALFIGADLYKARLSNAIFNKTDFSEANLCEASMYFFNPIGEVNLDGANLRGVIYGRIRELRDLQLNYNHLSDLFHQWTNGDEKIKIFIQKLVNCRVNIFAGVPYEKLRLYFNNRDKTQTLNLYNSNFSEVDLHGIDLTNTNLRKANFTGANLIDTNLTGAILSSTYTVLEGYKNEDLYLHYCNTLDHETKDALESILIAK